MRAWFSGLSERAALLLIVLVIALGAILLSLWIGGLGATAVLTVPALLAILQVTKGVWTPEGGGRSKIGMASLGIALAAVATTNNWRPLVNVQLTPLLEEFPQLKEFLPSDAPSVVALIFLFAVILAVNFFARDTTAMKAHQTPLDKDFPERGYRDSLRLFKKALENDLNSLDLEANWNAAAFVPLDAEVELQSRTSRLRKITDLLRAIRGDRRSKVFLILGDPGSGKSVALRKLCRDLLLEVDATGKVPIYINLKEWEPVEAWSHSSPPKPEQAYDFVVSNLKRRTDIFANNFIDNYFRKMFEAGRLFIVLDSFDEIPSVLDVNENSWLIDTLSDALFKFLAGAHESRGILASRIFRRPTKRFDARTVLEIRPFTEAKIARTLDNYMGRNQTVLDLLFNQRPEFVPAARNPFTVALISEFAQRNNDTLPANQAELYSSYIRRRLQGAEDRLAEAGLSVEQVVDCATDIADVMFTTDNLGLEAPVSELKARLPGWPVEEVVEILLFARLARIGSGRKRRFSFAHRRFNEYFVTRRFIQQPERVPSDSIPADSRWRDALVLYCEVAQEDKATAIAGFCWSELSKISGLDMRDPQYLRSIHCLRFLKEAFRSRISCIEAFRKDLYTLIETQISNQNNLLAQKLAVEAVGLLDPNDIDRMIVNALAVNNPWIDETALKSCHYLPQLTGTLNKRLMLFIDSMNLWTFVGRRKDLAFSFKLSNAFAALRTFCRWKSLDLYCLAAGTALSIIAFPFGLIVILEVLLMLLMYKLLKRLFFAIKRDQAQSIRQAADSRLMRVMTARPVLTLGPLASAVLGIVLLHLGQREIAAGPLVLLGMHPNAIQFALVGATVLAVPWYQVVYYRSELLATAKKRGSKVLITLLVGAPGSVLSLVEK